MRKNMQELLDRIAAFDDTDELCRWLEEFREDIAPDICEIRYYLEEIRQNLSGMQLLLQELRRECRIAETKLKDDQID